MTKGVTLVEVLVALGIFIAFAVLVGAFQGDIFSFNTRVQSDLEAQMEGRRAIVKMVSEMREMSPSSLGAYPIAAAATSSLTFFSEIDSDSLKEQVRYYIQNGKVYKSVIKPLGNPMSYNPNSAVITTVASNVANGTSTPFFEYFDTNYSGTSSPMSIPVNVSAIKLVRINLLLNSRPASTVPMEIISQVTPRNLKDNL